MQQSIDQKQNKYEQMMRELISSNKLLLPRPSTTVSKNNSSLEEDPAFSSAPKQESINQSLQQGMVFELIVVSKDDKLKEINVVLWKHIGQMEGFKYLGKPLNNISAYLMQGIIKDYEIGSDRSIFGYCQSYKTLQPGMVVTGQLTKTLKRQDNIVHEFSMRNTPNNLFLLGIVNYKPDPVSIEFFSKNGRFPLEFLLSLNREWNNPRYFGNLVKQFKLNQWETLGSLFNKPVLFEMGLHYQKQLCEQIEQNSEYTESRLGKIVLQGGDLADEADEAQGGD